MGFNSTRNLYNLVFGRDIDRVPLNLLPKGDFAMVDHALRAVYAHIQDPQPNHQHHLDEIR